MAATIGTRIHTWLYSRKVGSDQYGNVYYEARRASHYGRHRRSVIYNGIAEASKVPAEWHGWLHYTLDAPIPEGTSRIRSWQKPHQPNLTGTTGRYLPAGHITKAGPRAAAAADYEPWSPQ